MDQAEISGAFPLLFGEGLTTKGAGGFGGGFGFGDYFKWQNGRLCIGLERTAVLGKEITTLS